MSIRVITHYELETLKETLEDSFQAAKELDDIALMVDLANCMSLVTKLKSKSIEEIIGGTSD